MIKTDKEKTKSSLVNIIVNKIFIVIVKTNRSDFNGGKLIISQKNVGLRFDD